MGKCGFYNILFLLYMSGNYDFNMYLVMFFLNIEGNDFIVYYCLYFIFM